MNGKKIIVQNRNKLEDPHSTTVRYVVYNSKPKI